LRAAVSNAANPVVIINSGAYVAQELVAEFGELPPAFLPIGLGRLYELQARLLQPLNGEMCLTLPMSFDIPAWDAERIAALGFTVIRTPDALDLGGALLYTLGRLGFRSRPLRILHGDTLIEGIDLAQDDAVVVAEGGDGYRWAHVTVGPDAWVKAIEPPAPLHIPGRVHKSKSPCASGLVTTQRVCGYFSFQSAAGFAEDLAVASGDFYAALALQVAGKGLRTITPASWLDFGHVQTFFRSRRIATTERAFNSLTIGEMHVRKRSLTAGAKLKAEARWLREVPAAVAPFCARVLNDGEDSQGYFYDSEYEYMPTLAELFVFGRLAPASWTRILSSCNNFVDAAARDAGDEETPGLLRRLVVDKGAERLDQFASDANLDLDAPNTLNGLPAPSLRQCLRDIEHALAECGDAPSVMHGDFCFSNILYSFRTDRIRLIDPRGLTARGTFSLLGDRRYDLAKLMHSICGRYDMILTGHYAGGRMGPQAFELSFPQERWRDDLESTAKGLSMGGIRLGSRVVWAAMTSLFLSMPPLHADRPDRQGAFIANALRLHHELAAAA
jgi:hypothetical protein